MRYLPLDGNEREAMLTRIGVSDIDALFADIPADKRIRGPARHAAGEKRNGGRAGDDGDRVAQRRGRIGSVFSRQRRLSAAHSRDRRSSDPALRVPDQLHALSAGDRARHAASPVRVPDAGGGADRHGGRQRLDVRRLDRVRRSHADGAPPDAAQPVGHFGRAASAICRRLRDACAYGGRQDRPPGP